MDWENSRQPIYTMKQINLIFKTEIPLLMDNLHEQLDKRVINIEEQRDRLAIIKGCLRRIFEIVSMTPVDLYTIKDPEPGEIPSVWSDECFRGAEKK